MKTRYSYLTDSSARRQLALVRSSAMVAILAGVLAVGVVTRSAHRVDNLSSAEAESSRATPAAELSAPVAAPTEPALGAEPRRSFYMGEPTVY